MCPDGKLDVLGSDPSLVTSGRGRPTTALTVRKVTSSSPSAIGAISRAHQRRWIDEHDLEDEREHDDAHRVGGTRQEPGDAVEEPGAMVSQPPRCRLVPVAEPGQHADVHDELADAHEHGDHPDVAEDDDREQRDDR